MCGIVGLHYYDRDRRVPFGVVKAMADSIRHRGPDDEGFYVEGNIGLGHRRLSIIDLSTGKQPIGNEDGTCQIVFNGEIYNYKALRADLEGKGHVFRTHSDTEAIVHCYEEYGDDCVTRLNGMFAFAIWDSRKHRLFLARDHLGIKPLYYHASADRISFGSELKAVLEEGGIDRTLDLAALDAYFSYMFIPDPLTIFASVRKLPAGHSLACENGKVVLKRFWDVTNRGDPGEKEERVAEELEALLIDAVKGQLMSDVPLGVFLSGGIDSSSLVGLMAESTDSIKTFSLSGGQGLFNELPFARIVANRYRTEHHELVVPESSLETLLPKVVGLLDEPFADSSVIPTYLVSQLAREKVKVALSGEGGDELFAGYTWHRKHMAIDRYRNLVPGVIREGVLANYLGKLGISGSSFGKFVRMARSLNRSSLQSPASCFDMLRRLFPETQKAQVYGSRMAVSPEARIHAYQVAYERNGSTSELDNALYADLKVYLTGDLLTKVDRMSMANSLEVRVPFLDYRVAELAARLPQGFKLRGKTSKYILRKSMDKRLPDAIKNRKIKRGFSVPVHEWFRSGLKDYAAEILLDRKTATRGYLRPEGVRKMLDDHCRLNAPYGDQIFLMLVFELWARRYLDGAPVADRG